MWCCFHLPRFFFFLHARTHSLVDSARSFLSLWAFAGHLDRQDVQHVAHLSGRHEGTSTDVVRAFSREPNDLEFSPVACFAVTYFESSYLLQVLRVMHRSTEQQVDTTVILIEEYADKIVDSRKQMLPKQQKGDEKICFLSPRPLNEELV